MMIELSGTENKQIWRTFSENFLKEKLGDKATMMKMEFCNT